MIATSYRYIVQRAGVRSVETGQTGDCSKQLLSDLVNQAYGPTPSEVGLSWTMPRPAGRVAARLILA
jgi:hypothetical protein